MDKHAELRAALADGWERAHVVVAKECKLLGGFYVAGETFKCSLVETRKNNE